MLFHVWKVSGADPYCLYNGLGPDYRPLHDPSAAPRPPQFPERVRAVLYAFAGYARELEMRRDRDLATVLQKAAGGG